LQSQATSMDNLDIIYQLAIRTAKIQKNDTAYKQFAKSKP
jgi:hypothetical protein